MSKYPSFYNLLHGDESIPHKSHEVYNFSGDQMVNLTRTDVAGTGSNGIVDDIDEGGFLTTGGSNGDESKLTFNDIRQFDHQSCIGIFNAKSNQATNIRAYWGFGESASDAILDATPLGSWAYIIYDPASGHGLHTSDGTTTSLTVSTNSVPQAFTTHVLDLSSTNALMYDDNTLEATKTTNLPIAKMQPIFGVRTGVASASTGRIRYMECYNK